MIGVFIPDMSDFSAPHIIMTCLAVEYDSADLISAKLNRCSHDCVKCDFYNDVKNSCDLPPLKIKFSYEVSKKK